MCVTDVGARALRRHDQVEKAPEDAVLVEGDDIVERIDDASSNAGAGFVVGSRRESRLEQLDEGGSNRRVRGHGVVDVLDGERGCDTLPVGAIGAQDPDLGVGQ